MSATKPATLNEPMLHPHYHTTAGHAALTRWTENALARITVPHERRYLPTRHGQTHTITTEGAGIPVVLLHGINTNATVWTPQINALAGELPLIVPDVPGFAGFGSSTRIPYTGAALANWLTDVLDALRLGRALVVGGSAGGYFALKAAAYTPARITGVIMLNPCGLTPYRHLYKLTRFPAAVWALHTLARPFLANYRVARAVVQRGMAGEPDANNIELAYLLMRHYKRRSPPPLFTDKEWARVSAPVALLSSNGEPYTDPVAVRDIVQSRLPTAQVYQVYGAGHDINKEVPHLVNQIIREQANRQRTSLIPLRVQTG
jgi:pimeloyl-ACP methyl ester carboxylesterase